MYRGIYTAPPNAESGVQLVYLNDQSALRVDGWCGQNRIQSMDLPLRDLLSGLGITIEDCQQALGSSATAASQSATPASMEPIPPAPSTRRPAAPVARAAQESVPRNAPVPSNIPPAPR